MELHHLRYFVEVAHRSSFTRAAQALHMAQPSLSLQVRRLEQELGVTLLDRTGRRIRLTPAGETFLNRIERVLANIDSAVVEAREFQGLQRGRVTVGTIRISGSYLLPPVLAEFRRLHPGVEIVLRESSTTTLIELTRRGDVDVSLLTRRHNASELELAVLLTEPLMLAVPPGHPLARCVEADLQQAADEPFIIFSEGIRIRDVVVRACNAAGFAPRVICESSDVATIQSLVAAGMGVTLMPRMMAEGVRSPAPVFLPIRTSAPTRTLFLAWRRDGFQTQVSQAFVTLMLDTWGPLSAPLDHEFGPHDVAASGAK